MRTLVGWALALLLVIGAGVGIEATLGVGQSRTASVAEAPKSAVAVQIDLIAFQSAKASGDPKVRFVTWVGSSLETAWHSLAGEGGPHSNPAVYVLEMSGTFVPAGATIPPGAHPLTRPFTVMVQYLDATTLEVVGTDMSDSWVSLSGLGKP